MITQLYTEHNWQKKAVFKFQELKKSEINEINFRFSQAKIKRQQIYENHFRL